MTFVLSGTTITQSGTDTDPSGLMGITGVTSEITGTGEKAVTTYKISGLRLQINGDLSHDPDKEIIIFDTDSIDKTLQIGSGGIYRYGKKTIVNGVSRFSSGVGLIFTKTTTGGAAFYSENLSNIFIQAGGTFIGRGGVIFTSAVQQFGDASTVTVDLENTKFFLRHTGTGADAERDVRFDFLSSTSTLKNVVFDAIEGVIQYIGINVNALPPTFEVILKNATIGQFANTNTNFTLQNLDTSENIADADIAFDSNNGADGFDVINSAIGSGVNALPRASTASTRALGWCRVFRRTQFTVKDLSGTVIPNAKVYAKDNNNGNRKSGNGIDELADRIYNLTTNVNGKTPETDILLSVTNRLVKGTQGTFDTGDNRVDRRTKNDQQSVKNQPDELDFYFASYNHLIGVGTFDFRGVNILEISQVMFADTLITEADKSIVDAYTEIDTAQKFYDRAKAYIVDNYAGEAETIVSRSGSEINAGAYNVEINPSATSAFAFDGTKITIKASVFSGSITTTGTVTQLNGATVTGTIIDSNGTQVKLKTNTSEFGFYGEIDGTPIGAYEYGLTSKTITLQAGQLLKCVVGYHGYKSQYLELSIANLEEFNVILESQQYIDTSLTTNRDTIAGSFSTVSETPNIAIVMSADLGMYTPEEVMTGFDWYVYTSSTILAPAIVQAGTTNIYVYGQGTVTNYSPNFYIRLDNAITSQTGYGYRLPIHIVDGGAFYTVRPNTSNLMPNVALWTKQTANISESDINRITGPIELRLDSVDLDLDVIIEDTNELQLNQGNWLTATGFATQTDVTTAQTSIVTEINENEAKIDTLTTNIASLPTPLTAEEVNAEVDQALIDYDAPTKAELDTAQASIIAAMPTPDEMTAAELHTALDSYANKDNWKADVSLIETKAEADARQTALVASLTSNAGKLDSIISSITSGLELTAAERTAIANEVEALLLTDTVATDDFLDALKAKLADLDFSTADIAAVTASVRADLERSGGMLDNLPTLAEMEASSDLRTPDLAFDLGSGEPIKLIK